MIYVVLFTIGFVLSMLWLILMMRYLQGGKLDIGKMEWFMFCMVSSLGGMLGMLICHDIFFK